MCNNSAFYNASTTFCTGLFPGDFKCVHVNPVLKKTSLPKEYLNNYRPISNLSFISNVLETIVAKCLRSHIYRNYLSNMSPFVYNSLRWFSLYRIDRRQAIKVETL